MTINYTTLLGLAEPVTGTESGTWGDDVNKGITDYLDIAIAGTQTISGTQTAVTLSVTNGSSAANNISQAGSGSTGSSQYQVINCTGSPASTLTVTVPASSKTYVVINATSTSQSVKIVGAGPTTGVTIVSGEKALVAWNGSDFVRIGNYNGPLVATSLTASADSSFTSTGYLQISKGTTGQQPGSPATGMLRYNTTTNQFEGYSGSSPAWNPVGGASLSNDTSTASFEYPLFASATSGTATTIYTSNAKLLYKPSTGELQASELAASNGLVLNATTVSASYTVASGYNAMSVGPVTVASGQSVTVSSGQRWLVF
jgi:hypothetical protein